MLNFISDINLKPVEGHLFEGGVEEKFLDDFCIYYTIMVKIIPPSL